MRKPAGADVTSTAVGVEVQAPTSAGVSDSPAHAGGDQEYVVQPGDSLSALAERFHGGGRLWRLISVGTNDRAAGDPTVDATESADVVMPGRKLWILAHVNQLHEEEAMSESQPIIEFSADRTTVHPGEHATLRWRVENVKAVFFFRKGEPWREHGVVGQGERRVSPPESTSYRLRVILADDSVEEHKINIHVEPERPSGILWVDRMEITRDECVIFRWHVEGVKAVYFFPEGDRWQDHGVVGEGEKKVCPPETTTYRLRVIKADDSVEVHEIKIHVRPEKPVQVFSVDRMEIDRGECVTFSWRVEGVKAVYFFPEGERWQDHGVVGAREKQVCPSETTTYLLRVIKADDSVEIHYITVHVRG